MTTDEVAAYLTVNRTMIYRMLKRRQLPAFKIGSDFMLRRAEIDEWIWEQEQASIKTRALTLSRPRRV
jgi:excisionase family DNA binding protein